MSLATAISVPTKTNQLVQPLPHATDSVAIPHPSMVAVDASKHTDWAGEINPYDCLRAWQFFESIVGHFPQKEQTIFWSQQWSSRPEELSYRLPQGCEYSKLASLLPSNKTVIFRKTPDTCGVIVRLTKDFGDNVLPFENGFFPASEAPTTAKDTFENIVILLRSLASFVAAFKQPIYTGPQLEAATGLTMIMAPASSPFNQRWRAGILGVSGAASSINATSLL